MALRLAESLADRNGFDRDDVFDRYLKWWSVEGFDTGPTTEAVFEIVSCGTPQEVAVRYVDEECGGLTAGCNPLHRGIVLALCSDLQDHQLEFAAISEAGLTHFNRLAGEASAAAVRIRRAILTGASWQEALAFGSLGRMNEIQQSFSATSQQRLSATGFAPNVLQAALWFVGHSSGLEEALERSIDFAGPANYCPVLVGSLGGARWGLDQIDPDWYARHSESISRLSEVASRLATSSGSENASGKRTSRSSMQD